MFKGNRIIQRMGRAGMTFLISGMAVLLLLGSCKEKNKIPATTETATPNSGDTAAQPAATDTLKQIVFFGNSLSAGYGIDPTEAFPAVIQTKIDSLHLPYKVINAGLSGETTAGGKERVDWILQQPVAVFVLELGGNDGLRGIPVSETVKNLQTIIDRVKAKYPAVKIVLAGMQVPPNMGSKYANEFKGIYQQLADKNNTALVPFLLEGVGGITDLNQPDGIHPTAKGARIVADNVWKVLKGIL